MEKRGQYSAVFPKEEYSRLSSLLLALGLYDYDESRGFSKSRTFGVVHKGELKMIVDDLSHTPAGLMVVEKAFDDFAARIKWTREPVDTSSGIRGTANLDSLSELKRVLSFSVEVTLAGGGNAIKSQTLTGDGEFQFNLPPGIYTVRGSSGWNRRGMPPQSETQFVTVEAGKFTQVALDYRW